jgi:hypothetical protein
MTLTDYIKIVDSLIKENPDSTIKDYLELKTELELIEKSQHGKDTILYHAGVLGREIKVLESG